MVANVNSQISAVETSASHDQSMIRQIKFSLAELHRPNISRLKVEVLAGQVTLRGRVTSFYEKQLAMHSCLSLLGTGKLVDAVEVD